MRHEQLIFQLLVPCTNMSIQVSFGLYLIIVGLQENYVSEQSENKDTGPLIMNAFEMITLSQGLNLSALFDRRQV